MFEKCGGQKQSKKAGRPFKINFSLDIRIIQFIYLMYEVRTPQWETQTTNLWKQDYINIISNNHYTFFPWWWDSKIINNLSIFFFFSSDPLSHITTPPPQKKTSYRSFPFLIPSTSLLLARSFWSFHWFPPPPHSYPETGLLGVLVLFRLFHMHLMW